ncbi:pimeloyl-ACP methyl ester esterase BioH [Nitrosovibrio sp. Nv17]|uniref:pimeloyl-ACP methyl ester esterase BioH n=1 Tax=Nitrosovibrio sp. Nv17 TaxID=1855339 RepID=UPI000908613D|nr:pimeloyl-ACP methyl ester esterase BioH [Nitrosovibrio sp. Nv17]SFW35170.1 carboxylesterase BioH (pimeloyl-CoA synthesis) [Nitrosovibrio sp. Nv17]
MSLHVESIGAGPDLVLLHGWAMHGGVWRELCEQLVPRFRVHRVDLPGYGGSRLRSFGTFEQVVEQVSEILPDRCTVWGWSLGGQIALALALRRPDRVDRLVLVSTTPCFVRRDEWHWGMEEDVLRQFGHGLKQDRIATLDRFIALQALGDADAATTARRLRAVLAERNLPDEGTLLAGLESLLTIDLREALPRVIQPTLLLHGENDAIIPAAASRWMQQRLPDSELELLPSRGHAPLLFPAALVARI